MLEQIDNLNLYQIGKTLGPNSVGKSRIIVRINLFSLNFNDVAIVLAQVRLAYPGLSLSPNHLHSITAEIIKKLTRASQAKILFPGS